MFTLTEDDAHAIRSEIPEVQYVAGSLRGNSQLVYAENNWSSNWQGVEADWFDINGWKIASGDGFDARAYTGAAKEVLLGETVRRELFGEDDPLGQTIRIGRVPFTVVGMLKSKGQGGFGQDQDDIVVVPLETARRRLMGAMGAAARRGDADRARRGERERPGLRAGRSGSAVAPAAQDPARRRRRLQRAQHRRDHQPRAPRRPT